MKDNHITVEMNSCSMMKHAALIMAHKNLNQLIRLIKAIATENIDVFVHLDRKWTLSEAEIEMIKQSADNVYLLKKRISGELFRWSLPEITIELIKKAKQVEKDKGV